MLALPIGVCCISSINRFSSRRGTFGGVRSTPMKKFSYRTRKRSIFRSSSSRRASTDSTASPRATFFTLILSVTQMPPASQTPDAPLLALDTSGPTARVALVSPQGVSLGAGERTGERHSAYLLPLCHELLTAAGVTVDR